jgi:hypothetical protein
MISGFGKAASSVARAGKKKGSDAFNGVFSAIESTTRLPEINASDPFLAPVICGLLKSMVHG